MVTFCPPWVFSLKCHVCANGLSLSPRLPWSRVCSYQDLSHFEFYLDLVFSFSVFICVQRILMNFPTPRKHHTLTTFFFIKNILDISFDVLFCYFHPVRYLLDWTEHCVTRQRRRKITIFYLLLYIFEQCTKPSSKHKFNIFLAFKSRATDKQIYIEYISRALLFASPFDIVLRLAENDKRKTWNCSSCTTRLPWKTLLCLSLRMCDVLYINSVLAECSGGISRDFLVFQLPYFHPLDCNTKNLISKRMESSWRTAQWKFDGRWNCISFPFFFCLSLFPIFFWRR